MTVGSSGGARSGFLFVLNGVYVFGLTLWVMFRLLQNPSVRITEGLAADGLARELYVAFFLISIPIYFLTYFTVAFLIFIRRPNDGFALFAAIFLINFGAATAYPSFAEFSYFYQNPPLWYAIPSLLSVLCSWTLLIPFLVLYPDGKFVPRWSWVIVVLGFILTLSWGLFPEVFAEPTSLVSIFGAVAALGVTGASLYVQVWRYRYHFASIERQQAKLFVFALAIFLLFTFVYFFPPLQSALVKIPAGSIWNDLVAMVTETLNSVVIPIAIGIAILRYRLWDIDVIIRRTLQYGALTGLLALVYFGSVVLLQSIFEALIRQQSPIVIVISTLAIAALFNPMRHRVQDFIDRRFFRRKYDAEKALATFAAFARDEVDIDKLAGNLLDAIDETVKPERVGLWLRK